MTPAAQLKAVDRGVALLDQLNPKWFTKLRTEQFNLSDPSQCALGHVYGEYSDGLKALADAGLRKLMSTKLELVNVEDAELNGYYYGFEPDANEDAERMGQAWLLAADVRRKKAARARKRNATKQ